MFSVLYLKYTFFTDKIAIFPTNNLCPFNYEFLYHAIQSEYMIIIYDIADTGL